MITPLVSIGIVIWNSEPHLANCLKTITDQTYPNIEVIIVDNASVDRSLAIVSELLPDAHVIYNQLNTGFCHAHNQAIQRSRGKYYLALNPDVTLQSNYIKTLIKVLEEKKDFGSAGGKLLLYTGTDQTCIDSTGLFIDRRRRQFLRGHGEIDSGQYDHDGEVFGLDGAAPVYRREMLDDIKIFGEYFDENFFSHKEDVDLSWRARIFGWRCWYTHNAIAYHKRTFRPGDRTRISSEIRVHAVKNRYLLMLKNESKQGWNRDKFHIIFYDIKILLYLCIFEQSSFSSIRMIRNLWNHVMNQRNEITNRARVEPKQILFWFK